MKFMELAVLNIRISLLYTKQKNFLATHYDYVTIFKFLVYC